MTYFVLMLGPDYNKLSSNQLMEKINVGDENAFRVLYDRLWEPMYLFAFSLLKEKDVAKDMCQEVWMDFWSRRQTISNENIDGYLMRAVRFRVYKNLRDTKLKTSHLEFISSLEAPKSERPTEILFFSDTKSLLNKSISKLPKKCKEVFTLSRYEGLDNGEISERLGISKRTVETHISNAIKRLRNEAIFLLALFLF